MDSGSLFWCQLGCARAAIQINSEGKKVDHRLLKYSQIWWTHMYIIPQVTTLDVIFNFSRCPQ